MRSSDSSENPGPPGSPPSLSLGLIDPRLERDFDPKLYPKANGALPPAPEAEDRDDRIKIEFCAAYYQLNRLQTGLTEMRRGASYSAGDGRERELMQEIEKHLRIRDELEDRYTPYGVIAETILKDGLTVDIKFTFGDRTMFRQQRTQLISSTAVLFFPDEDDSDANEEICKS